MSNVRPLPRAMTWDDIYSRLEGVERNVHAVGEVVKNLATNVGGLIEALPRVAAGAPSVPPMRGPDDTLHDFDPTLPKLRSVMRDAVKDPRIDFTDRDAEKVLEEVIDKIQARRELGTWRWVKGLPKTFAASAIKRLPHWLFAGGAVELVHWLLTHHR